VAGLRPPFSCCSSDTDTSCCCRHRRFVACGRETGMSCARPGALRRSVVAASVPAAARRRRHHHLFAVVISLPTDGRCPNRLLQPTPTADTDGKRVRVSMSLQPSVTDEYRLAPCGTGRLHILPPPECFKARGGRSTAPLSGLPRLCVASQRES
jgi:hypothetical protein